MKSVSSPARKVTQDATDDAPTAAEIVRPASLVPIAANSGALVAASAATKKLGSFLSELDAWLELPFISPKAIATETERVVLQRAGEPFLFTLIRHGETEFDRKVKDPTSGAEVVVTEPAHLWLCAAQNDLFYVANNGEAREVKRGDTFIISQKMGSKIREKIATATIGILESDGNIPNTTMRFAKLSAQSAALGYSRPATFAVVDPGSGEVIEQ